MPGVESSAIDPLIIQPEGIAQTYNDLTLRLTEAILTDRVTAVTLSLENAPEGVAIGRESERPPSSAAWEVDIPVAIAGHSLHFTEARLVELSGTTMMLLSATVDEQGDGHELLGLSVASVIAPDGQMVKRLSQGHGG